MAAAPRVFLVFSGDWLEVEAPLAERRGALRVVTREAERKWNLQPNLYELYHASDKVDSVPALQRALDRASNGVCKLEISERLEGKIMRTMHMEMKALEDRVMAKVDAALTGMKKETELGSRLSGTIVPLVQCLATEQIELRNKIGEMAENMPACAVESKCAALKEVDELEQELQQECAMQAASDLDLSTSIDSEAARKEVSDLNQKQADHAIPTKQPVHKVAVEAKQVLGYPDDRFDWHAAAPGGFAYSSKTHGMFETKWNPGDKWGYVQLGSEVAAPFAQSVFARPLQPHLAKSMSTHRSCPLLPPLH